MKKRVKKAVLVGSGMAAMAAFSAFGVKTDIVGVPSVISAAQEMDYEDFTYELINDEKEAAITKYKGTKTDVVIPDQIAGKPVTKIGYRAFEENGQLTSIKMGNNVKIIERNAFAQNTNLKTIILENVEEMESGAFYGCSNLKEINWGTKLQTIGNEAFGYCTNLQTVNVPDSVVTIGDGAFRGCLNVVDINIGNHVTTVGEYAFSGCANVTKVKVGNNVTERSIKHLKNVPI